MAKGLKSEKLKGRNFALTILLGVFIAIMVSILFNLIVDYVYESPQYDKFCRSVMGQYAIEPYGKYIPEKCLNCTFSKSLQEEFDNCTKEGGTPVAEYDNNGCSVTLKECNMCQKNFEDAMKVYNRHAFFIFAAIGFALIVVGLFVKPLLIQIATLPSGAVLVIEAAMRNFDSKLMVIITFTLLIVAAIYLALKKLR
jgi:hypothetical protein